MENDKITAMLLLMLGVNVLLGLVDYGMLSLDSDVNYFNLENTPAGNMTSTGEINGTFTASYDDVTVDVADTITADSGLGLTDSLKSANSWWDKLNGAFGLAGSVLRQPAGFMKDVGFPAPIYNSFGILWYVVGIISFFYLLTGRN